MESELNEVSYMKAKQNLSSPYGMSTDDLSESQKDALKNCGRILFSDKSCKQVQHIINILALTALEQILNNKGEHYTEYETTAAELSNGIEFYLRDFAEYAAGLVYGAE